MWTAVILATAFSTLQPRWRWAPLVVGTLLLVAALGVAATLRPARRRPTCCRGWRDRPWYVELALGGADRRSCARSLVSVLWGRLWKAGAIAGIALALLLHVTVAVAAVYGVYWVLERLVSAPRGASPERQGEPRGGRHVAGPVPAGRVTRPTRASG